MLVHNPTAGGPGMPTRAQLVADIEALGWSVRVTDGTDLDRDLLDPGSAVIVAGGDGTVGKVAKRLARTGIPMAIVPTGTVNNVARSLGIGVDPRSAVASLSRAVVREVDLGVVNSPGEPAERFLEAFSVGVFAFVMAERATLSDKKPRRAFELLADELVGYVPAPVHVVIDGTALSDHFLLVSVMNLRSLGPALGFAPDAVFDDGLLDVVLVRPEDRDSLLAHLRRAALEGDAPLPHFDVHRARQVRLTGTHKWAHVDDSPRAISGEIVVDVEPRSVHFFLPARRHRRNGDERTPK
jgi:diacylglycerol kinase family enzyme